MTISNSTGFNGVPMQDGNNSGGGMNIQVPDIVAKRFNWGVFCLGWIWGIGNKTWIPFFVFLGCLVVAWIPIIGNLIALGLYIWMGIMGNKWAWQCKQFPSVEAFHSYQKKWAIAGIVVLIVMFILSIILTSIAAMLMSAGSSY